MNDGGECSVQSRFGKRKAWSSIACFFSLRFTPKIQGFLWSIITDSQCVFLLSQQPTESNKYSNFCFFFGFFILFLHLKSESFPLLLKMCGCLIFSRENKMTGTKRHSRNQIVLDFLFHLIQLNSHVFKYLMTTMWNASLTPLSNNSCLMSVLELYDDMISIKLEVRQY